MANTTEGERVRVVRVVDGDTVVVERPSAPGQLVRVRLVRIDAPESRQAGGTAATEALRQMIYASSDHDTRGVPALDEGGWVRMWQQPGATYGRALALLYNHLYGDLSAAMVRQGHAWVYEQYMRGAADQRVLPFYKNLQKEAREARLGLWAAADEPQAPWDWRKARRRSKGLQCDRCGNAVAQWQSDATGLQYCTVECATLKMANK